jgi:hypothetical protein
LLLAATKEIANRPAFSDRVIPSSPEYRVVLGEVRTVVIKDPTRRKSAPINKTPGPVVRIIVAKKRGALFGMRKADMAAACRTIGLADRPDLYWPPPRSIPNASPAHEIFVMKAAKTVQKYAIAA